MDTIFDSPGGIAVLQEDTGIASVMTWRPGLGAVEGRLSGMALRGAVVAAGGVAATFCCRFQGSAPHPGVFNVLSSVPQKP